MAVVVFALGSILRAEGPSKQAKTSPAPKPVYSQIAVANGEIVSYKALASETSLKKEDGTVRARMFHVSYQAVDTKQKIDPTRPLVFCFNGGPGSSAVWLHLGGLGPRQVPIPEKGTGFPEPPFTLVDNPHTLLAHADLVFVDPISTGFSRAEKDTKASEFHGINEDAESVAEFVRLFVTQNGRWNSPKYLLGESYGAVRACGVADEVQTRFGMYLNGVCLLSGLIDFQTLWDRGDNDLPYISFLPTLAATASFHGKGVQGLAEAALEKEVETFAHGPYSRALVLGQRMPSAERREVAAQLSRYTSIPVDRILKSNLRIDPSFFRKELLRREGKVVGRYDGRVTGPVVDRLSPTPRRDPSWDNVYGAFASSINAYLGDELGYKSTHDRPYEVLSRKVHPWSYKSFENRYVSVAPRLHNAMSGNPHLKLLVLCGDYDLATPPGAVEHSLARFDLPQAGRRIAFQYYEGGHMMYTNPVAMEALGKDLGQWVASPRPIRPQADPEDPKQTKPKDETPGRQAETLPNEA